MFDGISTQYDRLNRVISLGIDQSWRRKVVRLGTEIQPQRVLDIATGTGDLAIALTKTKAKEIIGLDISPGMLAIGQEKVTQQQLENTIEMVIGDSEQLEYPSNHFDLPLGFETLKTFKRGCKRSFACCVHRVAWSFWKRPYPQNSLSNRAINSTVSWLCPSWENFYPKTKKPTPIFLLQRRRFPMGRPSTIFCEK